jgi:hypothetical protein
MWRRIDISAWQASIGLAACGGGPENTTVILFLHIPFHGAIERVGPSRRLWELFKTLTAFGKKVRVARL